jgi:EAL domain-containing protein (putative c-di-GMP-specific phosphodiesterase class I)
VEALLRWQHPQRGLVMPGQFIGLAEESGLILPIGQWVLEQACRQIVRWGQDPASAKLVVSVNICALQIFQSDFVEHVVRTLQTTGADPACLQLELTESVLARNMEDVIDKMSQLVALGVTFSLDDFGTGYSSLNYLKRLPLHQLKIDASFVRDLMTDPNDAAITQTIIALGRSLDLEVIAEGVETVAQRDLLLRQGCPLFQGYLFGRPQPVTELKTLIRQQATALGPAVLT